MFWDVVDKVLRRVVAQHVCVCRSCVRKTDKVLGKAGDFSVCSRCQASITSKTGLSVREAA